MPYGITSKELDLLCERLADKLNVSKPLVDKAFSDIVREDVNRIAENKRGSDDE